PPKGEPQPPPEEKLLRAIFGEKAGAVKDTSLRVPPGVEGIVIDAKVFSRKGVDKDERTRMIEDEEIARLMKDQRDELEIIKKSAARRLARILGGRTVEKTIKDGKKVHLKDGDVLTEDILTDLPSNVWRQLNVGTDPAAYLEVEAICESYREQTELVKGIFDEKIDKLKR
ncbi:MAG TPA: DNA-directed RNA polymerase subunit beta, partial [Syntrophobacteraceae bacterium]|nr:DNA-directed RNA polymerase subunit beta [Syntrophobacteraceae bacterium]